MKSFRPILLILLATVALAAQKDDVVNADKLSTSDSAVGFFPPTFVTFTKLDFAAFDVGCGSEGDVCAIGTNKKLYCYNFVEDKWEQIPINDEISDLIAVDVDDEGKIYIVAVCGIYYFDCHHKWIKLPGSGKDIGVGVNFDVWKIGNDKESENSHNYGVWKLFCECDCDCICTRICLRFRKLSFNICDPVIRRKCHWFRAGVYGVAVDVHPDGSAAVVREDGSVYIVDAMTFEVSPLKSLPLNVKAVDVTYGNTGRLYVTGSDGKIYKYKVDEQGNAEWVVVTEATVPGLRICGTAFDHIFYTAKDADESKRFIYTSARHEYI